jgi:hypothetical protein
VYHTSEAGRYRFGGILGLNVERLIFFTHQDKVSSVTALRNHGYVLIKVPVRLARGLKQAGPFLQSLKGLLEQTKSAEDGDGDEEKDEEEDGNDDEDEPEDEDDEENEDDQEDEAAYEDEDEY